MYSFAIGKTLHADVDTEKRTRLDYARICVEVDAEFELSDDIQVTVNGASVVVVIEYQWLPAFCPECKRFGSSNGCCSKSSSPKPPVTTDVWQVVGKGKGKTKVNVESPAPLQVDYNATSSSLNVESTSCEVGGSSALHNVTTPDVVVTNIPN